VFCYPIADGGCEMEKGLREKYLRCRPVSYTKGGHRSARKEDLLRYLELAKESGVSDAAVVKRNSWYLDPRVTLKCAVPRCRSYDTCSNCPPHTPAAAETAEMIKPYRTGILLRWLYPRGEAAEAGTKRRSTVYSTLAAVEAAAFYDGYYFACGFGAGSCRRALCGDAACQELVAPEKGCRHPLLARPSMEAMGFDVYRTAAAAGWIINPAGGHCPEAISTLSRVGIVLIA
jgi:predicted metal-binding protein